MASDPLTAAAERPGFRDFDADAAPGVRELYRENHARQTVAFVLERKRAYLPLRHASMGVFDATAALDALVDESDPDLDLPQIQHALQTAEALRADGRPRWMILTGFLHDLGKLLCLFGEPQWAVVGDTFPVGCAWSDAIVHADLFEANPDRDVPAYQSELGIYPAGCGLDALHLSWGHDEYLYHVMKPHLPDEALAIIRYHSFYPLHRHGAYARFLDDRDHERLGWIRDFNRYDLYSKSDEPLDWDALRPFYETLVAEFLPPVLQW